MEGIYPLWCSETSLVASLKWALKEPCYPCLNPLSFKKKIQELKRSVVGWDGQPSLSDIDASLEEAVKCLLPLASVAFIRNSKMKFFQTPFPLAENLQILFPIWLVSLFTLNVLFFLPFQSRFSYSNILKIQNQIINFCLPLCPQGIANFKMWKSLCCFFFSLPFVLLNWEKLRC